MIKKSKALIHEEKAPTPMGKNTGTENGQNSKDTPSEISKKPKKKKTAIKPSSESPSKSVLKKRSLDSNITSDGPSKKTKKKEVTKVVPGDEVKQTVELKLESNTDKSNCTAANHSGVKPERKNKKLTSLKKKNKKVTPSTVKTEPETATQETQNDQMLKNTPSDASKRSKKLKKASLKPNGEQLTGSDDLKSEATKSTVKKRSNDANAAIESESKPTKKRKKMKQKDSTKNATKEDSTQNVTKEDSTQNVKKHTPPTVKKTAKITLQVGSVQKPLIDFGDSGDDVDPLEQKLETLEKEGKKLPDFEREDESEEDSESKQTTKVLSEEELISKLRSNSSNGWLWGKLVKNNADTKGIEAARARCAQALEIIPYRMEDQKLWMWAGMLESEFLYGTDESLLTAQRKASGMLDPIKVLRQVAKIYTWHKEFTRAELCYTKMMRLSRNDVKVWGEALTCLFQNNLLDRGRHLMNHGLKTLPQPRHVDIISKVAQLELKHGDKTRGMQLFESLVKNFPKRTDIWSVYVDMTIKAGLIEETRCLLQRACAQKLNQLKTKLFLRRFLEFEKKHGTAINVAAVKALGQQYSISLD